MRPAPPLTRAVLLALVLVAAAAVLRGVVWAAALPAWQGPDEPAHYAYVERLAGGGFPPLERGFAVDSPALVASLAASRFTSLRFRDPARPLGALQRSALPREQPGLPENGRAARGATIYPPAYYALGLPLYALPGLDTATARLFAVRTLSALLAGLLVATTFLLVREATGRPGLALAGGLLVGLPPLVGQASGIANPDILLAAGVAGLAWATLRLARTPGSWAAWGHAAAWALLVCATKPVGPPLAAVTFVAFLVAPRVSGTRRVAALAVALSAGAGALVAALALVSEGRVRSPLGYGLRYLWDFYRPRLPGLTAETAPSDAWSVWVETGVGGFGWLSVWLPGWAYALALLATAAAAVLTVAGATRHPRALRIVAASTAVVATYALGLHAVELESLLDGDDRLLQGRYLIAVAPLAVAGFVTAAAALPRSVAVAGVGAVTAAWAVLAVLGLDAVLRYFGA